MQLEGSIWGQLPGCTADVKGRPNQPADYWVIRCFLGSTRSSERNAKNGHVLFIFVTAMQASNPIMDQQIRI